MADRTAAGRERPSAISHALTPDRLSAAALVFFVLGAAAPLASTAGGTSTGWAVTGVTQMPVAFLVTAVLLLVFIVGYAAMARHVTNAGAIYTYVARGLGRVPGVGAAFVALLAYAAMQCGLYGGIGTVAASFADPKLTGVSPSLGALPWWLYSLLAWLLILLCGRLRVDFNSRVLGVLMTAECALMLVFDAIMLAHPHHGHVALATLSPAALANPGIVTAVVVGFTAFVGVEDTTNYSEEARAGMIGRAMIIAVLIAAAVYAVSAWAMSVATGPDQVVGAARAQGTELMFNLVGGFVGGYLIDIGHVLFLTSLFASALSFHNTVARYLFAMGREGVLPQALGHTSYRTGSPKNASMAQSGLALVVIVIGAAAGWNPMVNMFFWMGSLSALGVIGLMAMASIAVVGFFLRDRRGETRARRLVFPLLAALTLSGVFGLTVDYFDTMLGVRPGDPVAWELPVLLLVVFGLGLLRAGYLYLRRRDVFVRIGFGAETDGRPTQTLLAADPRP